eukprot:GILJ01007474.1.p1 GENE.GILJ01007474.1~~GILJ01007474.1.p1  ORF type:complete len:782 (-),score=120.61 GILJ01007474.1:26-2371(-)
MWQIGSWCCSASSVPEEEADIEILTELSRKLHNSVSTRHATASRGSTPTRLSARGSESSTPRSRQTPRLTPRSGADAWWRHNAFPDFRHVLRDSVRTQYFREYFKSTRSHHRVEQQYLDFWFEVEDWHKQESSAVRSIRANEMYSMYIHPTGKRLLALTPTVWQRVLLVLETEAVIPKRLFEQAQQEVEEFLEFEVFPHWLKSAGLHGYQAYLQALELPCNPYFVAAEHRVKSAMLAGIDLDTQAKQLASKEKLLQLLRSAPAQRQPFQRYLIKNMKSRMESSNSGGSWESQALSAEGLWLYKLVLATMDWQSLPLCWFKHFLAAKIYRRYLMVGGTRYVPVDPSIRETVRGLLESSPPTLFDSAQAVAFDMLHEFFFLQYLDGIDRIPLDPEETTCSSPESLVADGFSFGDLLSMVNCAPLSPLVKKCYSLLVRCLQKHEKCHYLEFLLDVYSFQRLSVDQGEFYRSLSVGENTMNQPVDSGQSPALLTTRRPSRTLSSSCVPDFNPNESSNQHQIKSQIDSTKHRAPAMSASSEASTYASVVFFTDSLFVQAQRLYRRFLRKGAPLEIPLSPTALYHVRSSMAELHSDMFMEAEKEVFRELENAVLPYFLASPEYEEFAALWKARETDVAMVIVDQVESLPLQSLIRDPKRFHQFKHFLMLASAAGNGFTGGIPVECLQFCGNVEEHRTITDFELLVVNAQQLFKRYLQPNSDVGNVEPAVKVSESCLNQLANDINSARPDIFDDACKEVLLQLGSLYQTYMESAAFLHDSKRKKERYD